MTFPEWSAAIVDGVRRYIPDARAVRNGPRLVIMFCPDLDTPRLFYTGPHVDSKRVSSTFIPGTSRLPGFGIVLEISMPHQRFACARLLNPYLTRSSRAF